MRLQKRALIGALAMTLAGAAVPAAAASDGGGHGGTPSARSFVKKQAALSSAKARAEEDEGGGRDEGREVRLRAEFAQSIQAAPARTFPVTGVLAAQRQAAALPVRGGRWTSPTDKPFINDPIPRGMNFGVGHRIVTGRMTGLARSGRVTYAGAASGGVWRSFDNGRHWHEFSRGLPRLSVGAVATDPRDGSVWVGTGEANNASENQYGTGVYRLARGASTWHKVGGRALFGAGVFYIKWIRHYVYAATNHGLYRRAVSDPMSREWRPVLQPNGPRKYPPSSSVTDLVAVPGTSGHRILAVVGWSGYSVPPETQANGFYVGSGARGSFHRITPTGDIDPGSIGRTSFSSSHGRLYAVVASDGPDPAAQGTLIGEGVFRSDHGPRGPWRRIADTNKLAASDSAMGDQSTSFFPGIQADYNQVITADPNDPDHVYLQLEEVYESTDAGAHWMTVGPYWNFDISCDPQNETPYNCPPTTHPDQHAGMIFGGKFWVGNDGGLWRRPLTWHQRGHWTNLNRTVHTTQNYSIDLGHLGRGYAYWGGLQDNGESYTHTGMNRVEQAFTGDGGDTIVAPFSGNKAVVEYVDLDMWKTTDGGLHETEISPSCITAANPPDPCDPNPRFIAPIERDVKDPTHWVAGGQFVWDDHKGWNTVCNGTDGCDWKPVYDTGDGHQITAMADRGRVTYAGWCGPCNPDPGAPFARGLATNYGGSWHQLSLNGVPNRYITSVVVDPADAAHVYLSLGSYSRRWIPDAGHGHVYESTNGGRTWRDISGDLPDAPVYHVALQRGQLVAGTEVGAFIASTRGSHAHGLAWARLGHGLPNVTVWDVVARRNGVIAAGTHGRGDWVMHLR